MFAPNTSSHAEIEHLSTTHFLQALVVCLAGSAPQKNNDEQQWGGLTEAAKAFAEADKELMQEQNAKEDAAVVQDYEKKNAQLQDRVQEQWERDFGRKSFNAWVAGQASRGDSVGIFAQGAICEESPPDSYKGWHELMEHYSDKAVTNFEAAWKEWKRGK